MNFGWIIPVIALLSFGFTWLLRHYALSRSLLDIPNARSSHSVPTPRGGGVAIVLTFMLALAFLLVIGVVLIADGFDHHIPKGYVYFAMAFAVVVELLNIRMRRTDAKPADLHESYTRDSEAAE